MSFIRYPSIDAFHTVRKNAFREISLFPQGLVYRGKIKLHGTNAAVIIRKNSVTVQSRNNIITTAHDNAGFASWVYTNRDYFQSLYNGNDILIYGEWAGPGINGNAAITLIDRKYFFPFMIQTPVDFLDYDHDPVIYEPSEISEIMGNHPEIYIIPWETESIAIDFFDMNGLNDIVIELNALVEEIDKCCPYTKRTFGISDIGEGLVYYPILRSPTRYHVSNMIFKVKGNSHKVNDRTDNKLIAIEPEVLTNIDEFVLNFVTDNRLEQGIIEGCNGVVSNAMIGPFLAWINKDIAKEAVLEIEALNCSWKLISKKINTKALLWFKLKVERRDLV